jgi:hypothetical protein
MLKDLRDISVFFLSVLQGVGFISWVTIRGIARFIGSRASGSWQRREAQAEQRRAARAEPPAQINVRTPATAQRGQVEAEPATILQPSPYEVADRIATIRLEPPVGVINLRVYKEQRVVRRDLIISEPRLRGLMRGRRHSLPDADYDPVQGLESIKEETIGLVERLINELGSQAMKAQRPARKEQHQETPRVERPVESPDRRSPATTTSPETAPQSTRAEVFVPRHMRGIAYAGELIRAGTRTQRPKDRAPYEIFEAVLMLDNGVEFPLRGAELEREMLAAGCEIGQRVEITPTGKVPVTLTNGAEGTKNLYRVRNLGAENCRS